MALLAKNHALLHGGYCIGQGVGVGLGQADEVESEALRAFGPYSG